MIGVKLNGRLGNQLFQYAFIYSAAKTLNTSFYVDKSVNDFILPIYFEATSKHLCLADKFIFSIQGYKNIFSHHIKSSFYQIVKKLGQLATNEFSSFVEPKKQIATIKDNTLYDGFFQSARYFNGREDDIRSLYEIKQLYKKRFETVKRHFTPGKKKTVIHIRRTDYVELQIALPLTYYINAIKAAGDQAGDYIFISDDKEYIEKEFAFLPNKYVSANDEIIDLQFLIDADICILSNSSFSWWGAWLNPNVNKKIFAPRYWLGFDKNSEYPNGISDFVDFNWITI